MVSWQVVATVILAIALVLLSLLIFRIVPAAKEWSEAAFREAKYTFCCRMFGCQPWNVVDMSKVNPICSTVCWGCACGEEC